MVVVVVGQGHGSGVVVVVVAPGAVVVVVVLVVVVVVPHPLDNCLQLTPSSLFHWQDPTHGPLTIGLGGVVVVVVVTSRDKDTNAESRGNNGSSIATRLLRVKRASVRMPYLWSCRHSTLVSCSPGTN